METLSKEKLAFKDMEAFDVWLRDHVKSIHYADNQKVSEGFEKVYKNSIELYEKNK
jgi:hypothetical protein